jgi:hypothetical protein
MVTYKEFWNEQHGSPAITEGKHSQPSERESQFGLVIKTIEIADLIKS